MRVPVFVTPCTLIVGSFLSTRCRRGLPVTNDLQSLARIQVGAVSEVQDDQDEGAEDEIWEATDIVEEEYETAEGQTEDQVDVVAALFNSGAGSVIVEMNTEQI